MKKQIAKYIGIVLSMAAFCAAEILHTHPFGAALTTALLFLSQPALVVCPAYLLFSIVFDFSWLSITYSLVTVGASFLAALFSLRFKRAKNALFGVFFVLSRLVLFLFVRQTGAARILFQITTEALAFLAFVCFLTPVLVKNLAYELLETEVICGAAFVTFFAFGAASVPKVGFLCAYFLGGLAVALCGRIGNGALTVGASVCFGSGIAICTRPEMIAYWVFAGFVGMLFSAAPRPVPQLSFCTAFVLAGYLFSPPAWQCTLALSVGACLAAFLPRSTAKAWRTFLFGRFTKEAARGLIDRTAQRTGGELLSASHIFTDMQAAMENVPEEREESAVLEQDVCAHCFKYAECCESQAFRPALGVLEARSAEKGRASVSELSPYLAASCENLTALIAGAGKSAEALYQRRLVQKAKSEGRRLVASQLGLMANVLRSAGERVRTSEPMDDDAAEKVCTELRYAGYLAADAVVAGGAVSVVVKENGLPEEKAVETIARVLHAPYKVVYGGADVLSGYSLWQFARAPRFDVAFSAAGSACSERSGDTHSFVYLGGDRFMMALCDGMGSGDEAQKASVTAIELIENFFKAGMDSMSAVACVNRFLAQSGFERVSTRDVTVIDLNSGLTELIKLSSPSTVIRTENGACAVPCASLPMGVMEEIRVRHETKTLRAGDDVIMATDGITDALGSDDDFLQAARALSTEPQRAANELLAAATSAQNGKLKDDATVLCTRIFERA
ncbi:MAG: SpoIIE family protein phosphatase [Clostridiales bacterium]|nr:SpoIIE family protein phosphatase [Clostridiales bacterium]